MKIPFVFVAFLTRGNSPTTKTGLARLAWPRPENMIFEVLICWPKMVLELLIFIDFG